MKFQKSIGRTAALLLAVMLGSAALVACDKKAPAPDVKQAGPDEAAALRKDLQDLLAVQRQIIVLLADDAKLSEAQKAQVNAVGQALFHDKLARVDALGPRLAKLSEQDAAGGYARIGGLLDFIESDPTLFDADRLVFRELLQGLQQAVGKSGTLGAAKLHKRLGEDLDALASIEQTYEREFGQIFSRFESRAIAPKREKWSDYLAALRKLHTREQILKDQGIVLGYSADKLAALDRKAAAEQETPAALPPKTLVLTFDDGPHPRYTEEIQAILRQYGAPAVFFTVGRNLGNVEGEGKPKLGAQAEVARHLMKDGFVLGNHSYTHAQLSKASGAELKSEILNADALLKALDAQRAPLFRFPYGAQSAEGMGYLAEAKLQSVMWQIDSLDWADPVPSSIADRVLREVDKAGRGIVLFHDIHERTVKALPLILDRLVAEGYQFAGWDGKGFSVKPREGGDAKGQVTTGYRQSWAVIVGIDSYKEWPKLQHAVADADAIRAVLQQRFGFAPERTLVLKNEEATRQGILSAFHDKLGHGALQKDDRVFVFFAGHGATRRLSSGRELGYIVPVDAGSSPEKLGTDAISMSELQNVAESLAAKHVMFVMDSCYSGLGLTRGGGGGFLRQNALRTARQMLTAGGADQLVADGGPNGHSVFTWTLMQALNGKADLNGDGYITGTELAAYIAPAVAAVAPQTPAFGSLPGSQGGEFVFELPAEAEYLNLDSGQLAPQAIALNAKLDAAASAQAASAPASRPEVADLGGQQRALSLPTAVNISSRQLAQRANDRGLQLFREQRYAEAEAAFTEALKLRADFALAANNLGFVYFKQDKPREAARWFENTIKLDPSRAVAYLNLGDAWLALKENDKAKQAFKTYLELAPKGSGAAHAKEALAAAGG